MTEFEKEIALTEKMGIKTSPLFREYIYASDFCPG